MKKVLSNSHGDHGFDFYFPYYFNPIISKFIFIDSSK